MSVALLVVSNTGLYYTGTLLLTDLRFDQLGTFRLPKVCSKLTKRKTTPEGVNIGQRPKDKLNMIQRLKLVPASLLCSTKWEFLADILTDTIPLKTQNQKRS
jgi:hypothetical protein